MTPDYSNIYLVTYCSVLQEYGTISLAAWVKIDRKLYLRRAEPYRPPPLILMATDRLELAEAEAERLRTSKGDL